MAIKVLDPAVVKVNEQLPDVIGFEHASPLLALTVMVPVGVPAPGATGTTAKLTVTGCPSTDGSGDVDVIAVVVPAIVTAWVAVAALPTKFVSPV